MKKIAILCLISVAWIIGIIKLLVLRIEQLTGELPALAHTKSGVLGIVEFTIISFPLVLLTGVAIYLWRVKEV